MKLRRQTIIAALDRDEADDSLAVTRFVLEIGDTSWNPADPHAPIAGPASVTYVRQFGSVSVRVYDVHMNATPTHHCPVCFSEVDTYRPTGTHGVLRAERHGPEGHRAAGGPPACAGSFGPVVLASDIERDRQRTADWRRPEKEVPQVRYYEVPEDRTADGLLSILNGTGPKPRTAFAGADGGPSLREFLQSHGEL